MNLLGKSLIVLIFVMSIFFMAVSVMVFATHENWKAKKTAVDTELQDVKNDNSRLQTEREELEKLLALERASRTQAIAALESEYQQKTQALAETTQLLQKTEDDKRALTATVAATTELVSGLQQEVEKQRAANIGLLEDHRSKFADVMTKTDENNQLQAMLERLQQQTRQLRDQLGIAEQVLSYNGLQPTAPVTGIAPRAEGRVEEVRGDRVLVSLGSDDGIRVGHQMDVSRGELYLGRIRIVKTDEDKSVGEIQDGFRRGAIQRDDRVRTQVK